MTNSIDEVTLKDMLYNVAEWKSNYILDADVEEGSEESNRATTDFIKCAEILRDLEKNENDRILEEKRIENEAMTNRKAEEQKDRFDTIRLALEAGTLVLTGIGLVMSFKTLNEYQEINLESVITNKDAVKAADGLFNTMFRRIG
jgi:hypothetical protein